MHPALVGVLTENAVKARVAIRRERLFEILLRESQRSQLRALRSS
jgi:hypothetical protein